MLTRLPVSTAFFGLLLLVALFADARVALRGNEPKASDESMKQALALLEKHKKPGNLIVHSPLLSPSELAPLGRMTASPDLPSARLRASRRILLLDVASTPMHGFSKPEQVISISGPRPL